MKNKLKLSGIIFGIIILLSITIVTSQIISKAFTTSDIQEIKEAEIIKCTSFDENVGETEVINTIKSEAKTLSQKVEAKNNIQFNNVRIVNSDVDENGKVLVCWKLSYTYTTTKKVLSSQLNNVEISLK